MEPSLHVLVFPHVYIYVRVRGKLFHPAAPASTSTDDYTPNLWGFNLPVESCSSKIDVYEMKDGGRNDWADKSPTEAEKARRGLEWMSAPISTALCP